MSKISPFLFLKQVKFEGKKVSWSTRKETMVAAVTVAIFSVIMALVLFSFDSLTLKLFHWILG